MYFFKVFLFEFDLIRYRGNFFFKTVDLLLVYWNMLHLVPKKACLIAESKLVGELVLRPHIRAGLLSLPCAIYGLLDSMLKVGYFVIYEVLINFHLLFKVSHFTLVDKLQNSRACILDCLYALFLEVEDFESYLRLERAI